MSSRRALRTEADKVDASGEIRADRSRRTHLDDRVGVQAHHTCCRTIRDYRDALHASRRHLAQRMIREGMKRGIERRGQMKPYKLTHPVKLQLTFKDLIDAEHTAFFPGVERVNGTTVTYTVRDMVEGQRFIEAALRPVH